MSHITVLVTGHSVNENQLHLNGTAHVSGSDQTIGWGADVAWTATVPQMNQACIAAAIAAAEAEAFTVGALDNRTLFGGGVGL